jgi:hypothetical protein
VPPLNPSDEEICERRLLRRTVVNRGALLFFPRFAGVHACCVRDVTTDGAGIRLSGLSIVPSNFDISSNNFHTVHRCRLVWRDGDFIGAQFEGSVYLDGCNFERSD